jgi:hypothetical protein
MDISQILASIAGSLITAAATLTGFYLEKKINSKKKPDLTDLDYDDLLKPIISEIKDNFNPSRINYYAFHNGEITFDNYHMKKLSMMVEENHDNFESNITQLQSIPTITFKRHIKMLRESNDGILVVYESHYQDRLSLLYKSYDINTCILCKVRNIKKGYKWSGILVVGFKDKERNFNPEELAWLSAQVNRIEVLVSQL